MEERRAEKGREWEEEAGGKEGPETTLAFRETLLCLQTKYAAYAFVRFVNATWHLQQNCRAQSAVEITVVARLSSSPVVCAFLLFALFYSPSPKKKGERKRDRERNVMTAVVICQSC